MAASCSTLVNSNREPVECMSMIVDPFLARSAVARQVLLQFQDATLATGAKWAHDPGDLSPRPGADRLAGQPPDPGRLFEGRPQLIALGVGAVFIVAGAATVWFLATIDCPQFALGALLVPAVIAVGALLTGIGLARDTPGFAAAGILMPLFAGVGVIMLGYCTAWNAAPPAGCSGAHAAVCWSSVAVTTSSPSRAIGTTTGCPPMIEAPGPAGSRAGS